MKFAAFERAAREAFAEIPDEYRVGIDGLTISEERTSHPTEPEVFTMGECLTESFMSEFEGPETTRSRVVLYWGSFQAVATSDPEFDWEGEMWETLTHELRHHLESLASEDALEGVDYAMEQEFRRFGGQSFDPFYYRRGDDLGDGLFRVEARFYLERIGSADDRASGGAAAQAVVQFEWRGVRWAVPRPAPLLDVGFLLVAWPEAGGVPEDELELVMVRNASLRERLMGILRRQPERTVGEWEAEATRAD